MNKPKPGYDGYYWSDGIHHCGHCDFSYSLAGKKDFEKYARTGASTPEFLGYINCPKCCRVEVIRR